MDVRLFDGGRRVDAISPLDRGLAYGDGLFETMRAHRGDVPWWDRHWSRLRQGATVLGLALPDEARARAELAGLLDGRDGVAKLLVTRGAGERGYAPGPHEPFWMLSVSPTPPARSPITLRWCATRLALQPALAGLKHCNRLEQVLARAEWTPGETADEGLMLDAEGAVVSAVAGNLFVLTALDATEARLATADVETADALFVCNAVRGILEVARLGDRTWTPHPQVAGLRARLAADHPAFASLTETP